MTTPGLARRIAGVAFAAFVLAVECMAAALLVWAEGQAAELGFAIGHGIASVAAAGLWHFLPPRFRHRDDKSARGPRRRKRLTLDYDRTPRRDRWLGYGLLALLVLSLPLFGLLGLLAVILPTLYRPIVQHKRDWRRVAIPPLPPKPDAPDGISSVADTRPLIDILRSRESSVDARLTAVLALRYITARTAVPILRIALADPVDDVRLLAYALLYRRDTELQTRIQTYEHALLRPGLESGERIALEYALAQLYWELSYSNLAVGAVEGRVLESAERHARAALAEVDLARNEHDANVLATLFLLARVLLRRGELKKAVTMFEAAEAGGFPASSIRPFLAEIAFRRRDFAAVKKHLVALDEATSHRPGVVSDMCRFWLSRPAPNRLELDG